MIKILIFRKVLLSIVNGIKEFISIFNVLKPKVMKTNYIKEILCSGIFVVFCLGASNSLIAKTMTAKADGNWSTSSTWKGGSNPSASDDVIISSGVTLNVDVATAVCNSITFSDATGTATLVFNSGQKVVVTGSVTMSSVVGSNGVLNMTNGGILECGSIALGSGTVSFTPGTGTVQLNASNTLPLSSFNNLIINGGTTTLGTNLSLTGSLTNNATLSTNTKTITLNGTVIQSISGITFYDLVVNNSSSGSAVTLGSAITVNHSMTLTKGIIDASSFALTFGASAMVSGASNISHIKGTVKKITSSTSSFIFPLGNGTYYRSIGISSPSNDTWTASYSRTSYNANFKNVKQTDSINLNHVSTIEYWDLSPTVNGSSAKLIMSWDANSNVINVNNLAIAHWNSTSRNWENVGSVILDAGSKTLTSKNLWSSYSPFTLGSTANDGSLPIELEEFKADVLKK